MIKTVVARALVTVIMYHSVSAAASRIGPYVISPQMLENDLRFLQENGYESITSEQMLDFVINGTKLPEKAVVLTFDDGHLNNVTLAEPLLRKYNFTAFMFVVGGFSDKEQDENPNYSYLKWDAIARLADSDVWEIGAHTWDMHGLDSGRRGVARLPGESEQTHRNALLSDFFKLERKLKSCLGYKPVSFAYPFGFTDKTAGQVLLDMGYKITFSCNEGVAELVRGDMTSLLNIKRYARFDSRPVSSII